MVAIQSPLGACSTAECFCGEDEECRGFRVLRDGARKFKVARSVTFYEQALVNAMRTNIGMHISDTSGFQLVQPSTSTYSEIRKGIPNLSSLQHQSDSHNSLTDTSNSSELKTSDIPDRTIESSWKSLYMTPPAIKSNSVGVEPGRSAQPKRGDGPEFVSDVAAAHSWGLVTYCLVS